MMKWTHILLALLIVMVWGFNFVAIETALQVMPPLVLGFMRFFLVSIPAVFFVKRPAVSVRWVIGYALTMFTLQFAFLFLGMDLGVPPSLSSVVLQSQVFFSLFLGALLLKERLRFWHILGASVSSLGIILIGLHLKDSVPVWGITWVLFAAAAWGCGNIFSKKMGPVDMVSLVVWGSLIAWPPLLLLSLLHEGVSGVVGSLCQLDWVASGALVYIAFPATLFGFGMWSWLLARYPLGTVAPFGLLVPVCGALSSVFVLGESFPGWKRGAGLLVIAGLIINMLGGRLYAKSDKGHL